MRNPKEIYIDNLLTLYLLKHSQDKGYCIDGPLKFQKLAFISELEMTTQKEKGLHLKFFRYNLGPYSKDLAEDYKKLEKLGLAKHYKITSATVDILNFLWDELEKINDNRLIVDKIRETINRYGKYPGPNLTNKVYDMKMEPHDMPGSKLKIRDIPPFTDLLVPEIFKANVIFDVPNDLLDILEEEFKLSDKARERINKEWPMFLEKGEKKLLNVLSERV